MYTSYPKPNNIKYEYLLNVYKNDSKGFVLISL